MFNNKLLRDTKNNLISPIIFRIFTNVFINAGILTRHSLLNVGFFLYICIMSIYLQSVSDPTLYFNGSTLNKRGYIFALFDPVTNARDFSTVEEAQAVSETFYVPVNIVEV